MGLEASCLIRRDGNEWVGKAHCGDGEISVAGDLGFRWKWSELDQVESTAEGLLITRRGEMVELVLGTDAAKWAHAIKNQKSRLDKLGLKPGHAYQAWGDFDVAFPIEIEERAGAAGTEPLDVVFVRLNEANDLDQLLRARSTIKKNGMIWAVWPKGRKEFREDDIRIFALENGLVDVKVASFSPILSALKLVIPVALR